MQQFLKEARKIIHWHESYYQRIYGKTIFNVKCQKSHGVLLIEGEVLLEAQKMAVIKALIDKIPAEMLREQICVLAKWPKGSDYLLRHQESKALNVYSRIISDFSKLHTTKRLKLLTTQIQSNGLPFRILKKFQNCLLVQVVDGTLGWIREDELNNEKMSLFKGVSRRMQKIFVKDQKKFQAICHEYLGRSYVFGANSQKAIDCSALSQAVIWRAFSVLLPKKSSDQAKFLQGIECFVEVHPDFLSKESIKRYRGFLERANFGGLIFLKKKKKPECLHVAIWYDRVKGLVIHSSRRGRGVVVENSDKLMRYYDMCEN